jgi:ferritin-like protein
MSEYHESWQALDTRTRDLHRALQSLQEELEAVDWYQQRIAVADDPELQQILAHNRDEEIEHAAMLLEWLRRHMDGWQGELETYLFSDSPITEVEEDDDRDTEATATPHSSLGIGALKGDT